MNGYAWGDELPTLSATGVRLRWLHDGDVPALHSIFADPQVMRYWSSPPLESLDAARELLAHIHANFRARTLFQWGIARNEDDLVIGTTTLYHLDYQHGRGDIGYALGRAHWGNGHASDAVSRALRFAFDELGLRRIEADADPRNEASIRVLERQGFVREGNLRERYFMNGELQDTAFYGLLKREWRGR
ncbi:MAG TPA: GNAT family N-acetyltransferase [Thermoanaerobaculia bacterium]